MAHVTSRTERGVWKQSEQKLRNKVNEGETVMQMHLLSGVLAAASDNEGTQDPSEITFKHDFNNEFFTTTFLSLPLTPLEGLLLPRTHNNVHLHHNQD